MGDERMPFDIEDAIGRVMLLEGGRFTEVIHPGMYRQYRQMCWENIPFIKALCEVGRNHQEELEAAWRQALTEPMPMGMPPLGADYHPPKKENG